VSCGQHDDNMDGDQVENIFYFTFSSCC